MISGIGRLTGAMALAAAFTLGTAAAQDRADDLSGESVVTKTVPSNPAVAAPPASAAAPSPAAEVQQPAEPAAETAQTGTLGDPAQPQETAPAATLPLPEPGWTAENGPESAGPTPFAGTEEQLAILERIHGYFNGITNLEGSFQQTDADNATKRGRFYIERPGKVRFDYAPPSKLRVVSNGEYLAIEDHDLNTTDRYRLESTPFRLLLAADVDLMRDASIKALDVGEDVVILTLEDKEEDASGRIWLVFSWPEIALKEWIISDPQGLNTKIEIANLEVNKAVDPKLFTFSTVGMPNFRQ